MRESTAIINSLTEYEFSILASKHQKVLFTDHKSITFLFTQKSNPKHKIINWIIELTFSLDFRKNLALPDTLSQNTTPELITRKTTGAIPQNIKSFLAKDEISPRLECKYAVKTGFEYVQTNNLQHFPLYLDCQNNHYEVDLLENSTFKPLPYSA